MDAANTAPSAQAGQSKMTQPADAKKEKKRTKKDKRREQEENNGAPTIKKPLSAYMLYNNNRRPVLRSEYPSKYFYIQNCLSTEPFEGLEKNTLLWQALITWFHISLQIEGWINV